MPPAKTNSISWRHMNDRQAVARATLIVSVLSLLVSWVLTGGLMWLLATTAGPREWLVAAVVTTIAPLMVAPPMAYKNFDLMRQLVESRREVERLSQNDELTGAYNRRYFMEIAQRELGLAKRNDYPVSLLLLDMDGFKEINDQLGHLAGDRALTACAEALRAGIRQGDVLGRFGGDEFLVLAPHTGLRSAAHLAERMRAAVTQSDLVLPEGPVHLRFSVGVVSTEQGWAEADELLRRADQALYRAKELGGDRAELAA